MFCTSDVLKRLITYKRKMRLILSAAFALIGASGTTAINSHLGLASSDSLQNKKNQVALEYQDKVTQAIARANTRVDKSPENLVENNQAFMNEIRGFHVAVVAAKVVPNFTINFVSRNPLEEFLLDRRRFVAYTENVVKYIDIAKKHAEALLTSNGKYTDKQLKNVRTKATEFLASIKPLCEYMCPNVESRIFVNQRWWALYTKYRNIVRVVLKTLNLDKNDLPKIFEADEHETKFLQTVGFDYGTDGLYFPGFQRLNKH
jgi:hypothetical protein